MALSICRVCTTAFAPARACPHCGADDYFEEGSMAKISQHGGATDVTLPAAEPVVEETAEPVVDEDAAAEEPAAERSDEIVEIITPYDAWLLQPLRDECERRGLSKTGPKADLAARLAEHDLAQFEAAEKAAAGEEPAADETAEPEA